MPEVASRHHLELVNPVVDAALAEAGVELGDVDSLAVTRGPGLIGALLVGVSTAKALAAATGKPLAGVDHLHGHVAANFLEPDPLDPPFLCLIASGGHTLLAGVALARGLRGARRDARRRRRRGARQGGPAARARLSGRAGDRARGGAGATPRRSTSRSRWPRDPRLDFSFSGLKTALLYAVRELGERARPSAAPTSRRAFRPRSSASWWPSSERALERGDRWPAVALGGGVAANSLLRERVGRAVRAARPAAEAGRPDAVHRQRGDDRLRGPLHASRRPTRATWPGTRADRGVGRRRRDPVRPPRLSPLRRGARAAARARPRGGSSCARSTSSPTSALLAAYLERIPVVEVDGRDGQRVGARPRRGAAARCILSIGERLGPSARRPRDEAATADPIARRRAALARRRGAPLALPPGADPGPQDGARDDLLAGARRVHAHQLDPDPPRPLGVRQVRQARASATGSSRWSPRSARSCTPRASTTSPSSAPATSARRSPAPTSSPTTGSGSSRSSTPIRGVVGSEFGGVPVRALADLEPGGARGGGRRRRARGARRRPPRRSPTSSSRRA